MKEVVWIFGESAAGKETFINYMTSTRRKDLIGQFGWTNKSIVACRESLDLIGGELDKTRDKILSRVPDLLEDSDVVLIKWQIVDSMANRLLELKQKLPDVWHRIIFIQVDVEEAAERLPNKKWWHQHGQKLIFAKGEVPLLKKCLHEVKGLFDVTTINGSKYAHYDILKK